MKKKFKGFSLVEAIVAIAVLGVGVVGALKVFPASIVTSSISRERTTATNLTQAKIEEVISRDYDEIGTGTIEPKARISSDPNNPFYQYWRQVNVTLVNDNLANSDIDLGLKKIIVTVFWTQEGQEKNISIPTLMTNK